MDISTRVNELDTRTIQDVKKIKKNNISRYIQFMYIQYSESENKRV